MDLCLKKSNDDLVFIFTGKKLKNNKKTYFTNFLGGDFCFYDIYPGMTFQLYDGDDDCQRQVETF